MTNGIFPHSLRDAFQIVLLGINPVIAIFNFNYGEFGMFKEEKDKNKYPFQMFYTLILS